MAESPTVKLDAVRINNPLDLIQRLKQKEIAKSQPALIPNPTELTEWISFIQFDEPPIKASEYTLTVTQTNNNATFNSFKETRQFAVSGERFSFQSGEIEAVFLPHLANGEFDGNFVQANGVFQEALLWNLTLLKGAAMAHEMPR